MVKDFFEFQRDFEASFENHVDLLLHKIGDKVAKEARDVIIRGQTKVDEWDPLTEYTLSRKRRNPDAIYKTEVLMETGRMAAAINYRKDRSTGKVDIGIFGNGELAKRAKRHEEGVNGPPEIPARPFLKPALHDSFDDVIDMAKETIESVISEAR